MATETELVTVITEATITEVLLDHLAIPSVVKDITEDEDVNAGGSVKETNHGLENVQSHGINGARNVGGVARTRRTRSFNIKANMGANKRVCSRFLFQLSR